MEPARDGVGRAPERRQVVRFDEHEALVGREPLAGDRFVEDALH